MHKVNEVNRAYHSLTKDLIANEIFRRVQPKGMTMGEYMHMLSEKYGIDVHITLNDNDFQRAFDYKVMEMSDMLEHAMKETKRYTTVKAEEMPELIQAIKRNN